MNNLKPAEIIILASGAVLLIFSFLDWFFATSAWDFFPLLVWPAIFGAASAIILAIQKFGNSTTFPSGLLGFTWNQFHFISGLVAVLITVGTLIAFDGDKKIGLYFSCLGAIGLLVGAIMLANDRGTVGPTTGTTPPQPF